MGFKLRSFISDTVLPVASIYAGVMTGGLAGGLMMSSGALNIVGKNMKNEKLTKLGKVAGYAALAVGGTEALAGEGMGSVGSTGQEYLPGQGWGASAATNAPTTAKAFANAPVGDLGGDVAPLAQPDLAAQQVSGIGESGGAALAESQPLTAQYNIAAPRVGAESVGQSLVTDTTFSAPNLGGSNLVNAGPGAPIISGGTGAASAGSSWLNPTTGLLAATVVGGAVQGRAAEKQTEEMRRAREEERAEREAARQRLNAGMLAINMPFRPKPRPIPGRVV